MPFPQSDPERQHASHDENNPENKAHGKIQYIRSVIVGQPFLFMTQILIWISWKALDYLPGYDVLITSLACDFCYKSFQHLICDICIRIKKQGLKFIIRVDGAIFFIKESYHWNIIGKYCWMLFRAQKFMSEFFNGHWNTRERITHDRIDAIMTSAIPH